MKFGKWIRKNYDLDDIDSDADNFTVGDMEAAFNQGATLEFSQEELDRISSIATESMHQEFAEHDEESLKKVHPMITPGMVNHILKAMRRCA